MERFLGGQGLDTTSLVIGSLVIAVLAIALFTIISSKSAKRGNTILIVGPSDSGKTAIFSSLVFNTTPLTSTSLQLNSGHYKPTSPFSPSALTLVDIPGHPRIRNEFTNYINGSKGGPVRGIVFVCDVSALARNASVVAEHLHLVMNAIASLPPSSPSIPPLLVLAHKSDLLPSSQSAVTRVKTILERELEKRRASSLSSAANMAQLGDDDAEGEGRLGGLDTIDGEKGVFSFDKWDGGEVSLASSWVMVNRGSDDTDDENYGDEKRKPKGDGLEDLVQWIVGLR